QVRGIAQMLEDGRECRDIVTQLSAANRALEQAGFMLVAAGLTWCVEDPERSAAEGYA
ncbi:MAG: metal-sensitive transcriptional regulator, partial [Microthrixaceae bacterium]|nr:metal-sensitive transcriptional regulator [Microthrixaceae bacterium]